MRLFRTILLVILTILSLTAAVIVTVEGNLSSLIGYMAFNKGERLFPYSHEEISEISWMRVQDVHATAEAHRLENGVWWLSKPWNDRMDPIAAAAILQFTYSTTIVDALPLNNTVRNSMREFGVETTPVQITLKKADSDGANATTLARYTLGSAAPWFVDNPEHKTVDGTTYMRSNYHGNNDRILVGTGNILPLFRESINHLRDHRPLLLPSPASKHPNQPCEIVISHRNKTVKLQRDSLTMPWQITEPLPLQANAKNVFELQNNLQLLTASKVSDPEETLLPETPEAERVKITIRTFGPGGPGAPVTLTIYPRDSQSSPTVKATVSDRRAVFDLPFEDNDFVPGIETLRKTLDLSSLRSPYLIRLNQPLLNGISIRPRSGYGVVIRLQEGDKDRSVSSKWLYSAEGHEFTGINEEQLMEFIKTFISAPVSDFMTDSPGDLGIYGLTDPQYIVTFGYKMKDDSMPPPQTLFIGQGADRGWYAMESGKPSVYKIGEDFMKVVRTDDLVWRPKKLIQFSRLYLKTLELARAGQHPLVLDYDHLLDTWKGVSGGRDVTMDINPNRARYYLTALENMYIRQWLPYSDQAAADALQSPVFTLRMELEEPVGEETRLNIIDRPTNSNFTHLPLPAEEYAKRTVTLQIAPAGEAGYSDFYYGRISTSPYYFIIDMNEVRKLGASVYEE